MEHIYGEKEHQTDKSHDTRYRLPCKEGLACFPPTWGLPGSGKHMLKVWPAPLPLENAWWAPSEAYLGRLRGPGLRPTATEKRRVCCTACRANHSSGQTLRGCSPLSFFPRHGCLRPQASDCRCFVGGRTRRRAAQQNARGSAGRAKGPLRPHPLTRSRASVGGCPPHGRLPTAPVADRPWGT